MAAAPDPTDPKQAPAWTCQLMLNGHTQNMAVPAPNGKMTVISVTSTGTGIVGNAY